VRLSQRLVSSIGNTAPKADWLDTAARLYASGHAGCANAYLKLNVYGAAIADYAPKLQIRLGDS
jgi:hypothetical protein